MVSSAPTLAGLYQELALRHGFGLSVRQLKASLNGDWVDLDAKLSDGDEVVFIPPVAGG